MTPEDKYILTSFPQLEPAQDSESKSENLLDRETWSNRLEFLMSCMSYAVGLGNVWRFPYVCYKNGGGAFLFAFFIILCTAGFPLIFLELAFGQFASEGVVSIWKVSPIFQGVGWAMFVVSSYVAIYYNMIIAWVLYYFFESFASRLPWSYCGDWSTEYCVEDEEVVYNCSRHNGIWFNHTCVTVSSVGKAKYNELKNKSSNEVIIHTSSDEYFHRHVLEITGHLNDFGGIKWQLAMYLLLAWVIVFLCLIKGIKTSGKAVYFTAIFPYFVLFVLFVRGMTLEGSVEGLKFFITPVWKHLLGAKVWCDAAVQVFFSLSPCMGGLITLSSYNTFHNNCFHDAVFVTIADFLTSIFAGLVIFTMIGYMSHTLGQPVSSVIKDGAGLAFVVYPDVVTKLPVSQLWSVLFFSMLFTLGLGTQITLVTTAHTTLKDYFPDIFLDNTRYSLFLLLGISGIFYIVGLAFCTRGGLYLLQLFDNYAATYSLLFIGVIECIAISWVYGSERFLADVHCMLGKRPADFWMILWKYVAPIILMVILIFSWSNVDATTYGKVTFPFWADLFGWMLSLSSMLCIPVVAMLMTFREYQKTNNSVMLIIKKLSKPTEEWGPRLKANRIERDKQEEVSSEKAISSITLSESSKE